MAIQLDEARKKALQIKLATIFEESFDENLSDFKFEQLLDLVLKVVGPAIYNQAVQDVRGYFQSRIDDLDGEVYLEEER